MPPVFLVAFLLTAQAITILVVTFPTQAQASVHCIPCYYFPIVKNIQNNNIRQPFFFYKIINRTTIKSNAMAQLQSLRLRGYNEDNLNTGYTFV